MTSLRPALCACLLLACSRETIVASRSRVDGGSGQDAAPRASPDAQAAGPADASCELADECASERRCRDNDDCERDEYCEKDWCDEERGTCSLRPTLCDSELEPVCGCDGLTYFNDCLRRVHGTSRRDGDECGRSGQRCDGPGSCTDGAYCAAFVPRDAECSSDEARRRCWVLPASCDGQPESGDRFRSCDDSLSCVDGCVAIRSELPVKREESCP